MKKSFTHFMIAFLAVGCLGFLGSCNKAEDDPAGGGGGVKSNSMNATIAGKALNTESIIAAYENNGYIDITANDKDQSTTLSINFDVNGAATQTIGGTAYGAVQLDNTMDGLYQAETGSITITTNDKTAGIIEGTFSFNAKNTKNAAVAVTNGTFYVKYNK